QQQLPERARERGETGAARVENDAGAVQRPLAEQIPGAAEAKRQAREHHEAHHRYPLDRGEAAAELRLDVRQRDVEAAEAIEEEKRAEADHRELRPFFFSCGVGCGHWLTPLFLLLRRFPI